MVILEQLDLNFAHFSICLQKFTNYEHLNGTKDISINEHDLFTK